MADETVNWPGASDQRYEYSAYPLGTPFKDIPGNYIFAKLNSSGRWSPVYIGETGSLSDRIPTHEKLPCVRRQRGNPCPCSHQFPRTLPSAARRSPISWATSVLHATTDRSRKRWAIPLPIASATLVSLFPAFQPSGSHLLDQTRCLQHCLYADLGTLFSASRYPLRYCSEVVLFSRLHTRNVTDSASNSFVSSRSPLLLGHHLGFGVPRWPQ